MKSFTIMMFTIFLSWLASGQNAVFYEIQHMRDAGMQLQRPGLIHFLSDDIQNRDLKLQGLQKGTIISIDHEAIESLFRGTSDFISIKIPVSEGDAMVLTLKRHEIFTQDFTVLDGGNSGREIAYTPGIHYKGIVEGDQSSVVAVSVFHDQIMGLISNNDGNFILGQIKGDRENRHVFYNEKDLDKTAHFECGTMDDGIGYTEDELKPMQNGRDEDDCVRVYIEIDDDIVEEKGGAVPATNFITGIFNQSIVLFDNEDVNVMINQILVWTTTSPYSGSSSNAILASYQANTGTFNGNLSHFVSYAASGGIAAGFNGICNSNPDMSKCFSSIDSSFENVPVYSWSVQVVTHEMGHLMGSRHTHACVWNGNNTAIDGCSGSVEGNCLLPGYPADGGTIMSYCHTQEVGTNFTLGFGPEPGNVIRNRINTVGNCLAACGPPPPPPEASYCTSSGVNNNFEYINKVKIGSINHQSGNNGGYGNFTSINTHVVPGTTYTITLTPGFANSSYNEYWRVWIDYNHDFDWSDPGEQVGQGSGKSTVSISFMIPNGLYSSTTRMRVSMHYNSYPSSCGSFNYGEVEDYSIVILGVSGASCSDGIQNQGETGVDCGGPCKSCSTCTDGVMNQGETGIDCGGPCPVCPTCDDNIQNQGESGVDCGGPCDACLWGNTILLGSFFEKGWDSWLDGGVDAARLYTLNSYEGNYSIRLVDNEGVLSSITSPSFNLTDANALQISFHFYAFSMETGEDFLVRYNDGTEWVTIATFARGINFKNNAFYSATVYVPNFKPTSAGSLRIQCDANDNNDQVFIDQVTITKFLGTALIESYVTIREVEAPITAPTSPSYIDQQEEEKILMLYPNPAHDFLNMSFQGSINNVKVFAMDGIEMKTFETDRAMQAIDISQLQPGFYIVRIESEGKWYLSKFSKL